MSGTVRPRLRIYFEGDIAMGPGKAALLETVARTGSIAAAARELGMSYRRAWLLVDTMNRCFRAPLVEASKGGAGGGGARVTALGMEALGRYRDMEAKAMASVAQQLQAFMDLLAPRQD